MKARLLLVAALALGGCGRAAEAPAPSPAPEPAAPAGIDLAALNGRVVALGAGWRLDAEPQLGMILTTDAATTSAPYAAPARDGETGARIASGDIALTLADTACTHDGAFYPMTAQLRVGAEPVREGCAFARWDAQLTRLLPAIDSCLSLVTDETPFSVTYAAPEGAGQALVRMRNADGGYDCHAPVDPAAGEAIIAAADPALKLGGDGAAIFLRAPGENPGGQCYEAPEVRAPDGTLLGWMDDPEGC